MDFDYTAQQLDWMARVESFMRDEIAAGHEQYERELAAGERVGTVHR